jgi:hypothetical protein
MTNHATTRSTTPKGKSSLDEAEGYVSEETIDHFDPS